MASTKNLVRQRLKTHLKDLPRRWNNRYDDSSRQSLQRILFLSLVGDNEDWLRELFCGKVPDGKWHNWNLSEAQGAVEGAEYTEAARGKPCGHILKIGEATYRCKTCTADDTCVLCSRCFEASDHRGHMVTVSLSPGNAGCCDCGDEEAWRLPVHCAIHSAKASNAAGKIPERPALPADLVDSISATVGVALDYFCDVMSCAPEELRKTKVEAGIREDEMQARLLESAYGGPEDLEDNPEFALLLWNDEKHAVHEVQEQVARACKRSKAFGLQKAHETDEIGRSFLMTSANLPDLLNRARIIEQIKITVTIRSARDTFREQMCSTIIEWLLDIAGCKVGQDGDILSRTICSEMLQPWERGSQASNFGIGRDGIYDHEIEDEQEDREILRRAPIGNIAMNAEGNLTITVLPTGDTTQQDQDDDDLDQQDGDDAMDVDDTTVDRMLDRTAGDDAALRDDDSLENSEATLAGYPPPPPPPVGTLRASSNSASIAGSGDLTPDENPEMALIAIPQTPYTHSRPGGPSRLPWHWRQGNSNSQPEVPFSEDIRHRVRLDWMILYDLRLWKKARIDLRNLYINTMVTLPDFKRVLGLRFAGLYTLLAQLYLIADREPDLSVIYLSLQMLTTPSITREVVDRCNFLTVLIAILYTFLTTRQVGRPADVSPSATLAFDAGSVTNRRMYHFFCDLKYLFQNEYVQQQLRTKRQYTLQFLDLIKLPQGICPNLRAFGEHVEYETDAWISASILTREVNKLCRQFAEAFKLTAGHEWQATKETMRIVAVNTVVHCLGLEKDRFTQAEVKGLARFKQLSAEHWDVEPAKLKPIVAFRVDQEPISFHHVMHYTLSWLIDGAKSMAASELRDLLSVTAADINYASPPYDLANLDPESYLMVLFDFPLRVCVWIAQMKAGLWVRNGLSLRHQMIQYRNVNHRHLAHQHDYYLLQVAMVICEPNRMLLSMIDRFGLVDWMRGRYIVKDGDDHVQMLDVVEDFLHLLIIVLSERTTLQPVVTEEEQHEISIRRDLIHVLCFKPLSYSDLTQRLVDRFQELDEFQGILSNMTNYKAPEGLSDTGTFELKKEYLAELDPYIAHYTKNQRDEAESAWRTWVAEKSGRHLSDVVFEPQLRELVSGTFVGLAGFIGSTIFAQIVQHWLLYALQSKQHTPNIPVTRIESFLHVVLHLVLLAVNEDTTHEESMEEDAETSFVHRILTRNEATSATFGLLYSLLGRKDFETCHAKIKLILLRTQQKRPRLFQTAAEARGVPADQQNPTPLNASNEDLQKKKKKAESAARAKNALLAMQKQQADFLSNEKNIEWGSDIGSDDSISSPIDDPVQMWDYPSGNCIYCQEECSDDKLYGTFALLKQSNILRTTDLRSKDYLKEVLQTPPNLDRSAAAIRPYGIAGWNHQTVQRLNAAGDKIEIEKSTLGKGYRTESSITGPVSSSCGHIMHYHCFESYNNATIRRQTHQIARHHPERLSQMEFVCPLCKALGNSFLPIIWKGKEKRYPGILQDETSFDQFIANDLRTAFNKYGKLPDAGQHARPLPSVESVAGESLASGPLFRSRPNQPGFTDQQPSQSARLPSHRNEIAPIGTPQHSVTDAAPAMPGNFPDDIYSTSPPLESAQSSASGKAMTNVYYRLRETVRKNKLRTDFSYFTESEELSNSDSLAQGLAHSVAATEIAQRGIDSETSGIFVEGMSMVTMTHLRVLSDMITSYISAGAAQGAHSRISQEIRSMVNKQMQQLFRGHPGIFPIQPSHVNVDTAMVQDPFTLLTECTLYMIPKMHVAYHHITQVCYMLEIVKDVHAVLISDFSHASIIDNFDETVVFSVQSQAIALQKFLDWSNLAHFWQQRTQTRREQWEQLCVYIVRRIRPNLLTFLRKTALLVNVARGVDFAGVAYSDPTQGELERLTHALQLPSLTEMLNGCGLSHEEPMHYMVSIVQAWIEHTYKLHGQEITTMPALRPTHPAIFELVGLPAYYDTLLDEMTRRRCPSKPAKEMSDPAVCLFCGEMMCSQSVCCTIENKGGCNRHMARCGRDVGLFLHIKKCHVLYLHDGSGSWGQAPYLDRHGETDPGLRRNRQLMLNQKRYDALLRTVWLNHVIPTTISRKLEADINNGGWETL